MTAIEEAQARLAERMRGVIFPRINGEPIEEEARKRADDLYMVAGWFDEFIEAYGTQCREEFGSIDVSEFRNQVRNALDGNATYELTCAADRLREAEDEYLDDAVGWNKAEAEGVS